MPRTNSASRRFAVFRDLFSYKSAITGFIIIILVSILSVYAIIVYPPPVVTRVWSDPEYWRDKPVLALPTWYSSLTGLNLPPNIVFDTREQDNRILKYTVSLNEYTEHEITLTFNYDYDAFPSEINAYVYAKFKTNPLITITFIRPDGREIKLWSGTLNQNETFLILSNSPITKKNVQEYYLNTFGEYIYDPNTEIILFAVEKRGMEKPDTAEVLKSMGKSYRIKIRGTFFEKDSELNVRLIIYGRVWGILGTDDRRRDLLIPLIWGAPVALSFGISLSVIISLLHMFLGSISAWFGGKADFILQKITEIYMTVPFLSVLVMIAMFYKISIEVVFVSVIILSLFGGGVKSSRALALQIKQQPFIEAAKVYGASGLRIVVRYIIYAMAPTLVPGIISSIPGFVFLEAALAYLGLGDPVLPTWGKTINEANSAGALYHFYWWWILPPVLMLISISLAFSLMGYALDKIVNPKLREL
ncbi:MAG: ABC transporter permease [Thermoproteota archaeon]